MIFSVASLFRFLDIVAVVLKPRSYKMPTFQEREKNVSFFYNDVLEIEIL